MKYNLLIAIGFLLACAGCYNDDDDIHVTEGLEVSYTLPQGNHPYDATIVDWYEQYGFYTLYIFEDKDIYWANTNWEQRFEDSNREGGNLQGAPADEDYVDEQLELFQYSFMDVYPDSLIANYMPLKLLLCSDLWGVEGGTMYNWSTGEYELRLAYTRLWAREGWDYIAINGGSNAMDTITVSDKEDFIAEVNEVFLERLYENGVLEIPEEFGQVSDYSTQADYRTYTIPNIFELGFVRDNPLGQFSSGFDVMVQSDFESFLPLLARSMNWLEATPGELYEYNQFTGEETLILKGILSRDVNGLIRQKYNILMNMLAEKGINIQRLQYPEFD